MSSLGECLEGPSSVSPCPQNHGFRVSPQSVSYPTLAVLREFEIRDVDQVEAVYAYAWVLARYFTAVHRLKFGEMLPDALYRDATVASARVTAQLGDRASEVLGRLHENHERATAWCFAEAGK